MIMTEDTSTSTGTVATQSDGTTGTTTGSTDGTAEQVAKNDPEKNKILAEIEMSESLRDMYDLEFELPHTFKGLHTNRFIFMELNDQFYEQNYAKIIDAIKNKKFARYAGFEKGRFFVERHEYGGGIDGSYTKLKVNPLANSYGTYMKQQQQAEKTLIQAMNQGKGGNNSGGGLTNVSGQDCGADVSTWTSHSWGPAQFEKTAQKIIGNSSANYATDTASMSAEEAVKSIKHSYSYYNNNLHCPQELWKSYPNISCNCADWARLVKCICDVHGVKCAIHHGSRHYWNYVYINNKWESVDLCTNRNNTWDGHLRNTAGWQ